MKSIFDISVSIFPSYHDAETTKVITLKQWINSSKYKSTVMKIRASDDKKQRDILKSQLPAITPAGVFSKRGAKYLTQASGFLQFDLDAGDNPDMMDTEDWKNEIMKLGASLCQISVSGKGLWGLFQISNPERYEDHFRSLYAVFENCGMIIDKSCRDIARLRGYSFDEHTRINPDGIILSNFLPKPSQKPKPPQGTDTTEQVKQCLREIERTGVDITSTYEDWWSCGCSLAAEFGEMGRGYFHATSQNHPEYDAAETDKKYDECLKGSGYSIGTFFHLCKNASILYKKKVDAMSIESETFCQMAAKNPALLALAEKLDMVSAVDGKPFICDGFSGN